MSSHQIYRFKLNEDIVGMIHDFSKLHEKADKKTYKEKWTELLEINKEMIEREKRRLKELGFHKNVEEKMYRSGRYYFRKKSNQEEKTVKPRRKYIACDISFIELIDTDINTSIETLKTDFKPSNQFLVFEEKYKNEINVEIDRMLESTDNIDINKTDIVNKIKKTYKNRYYLISHNK
jgi:hypothetical protein